MKKIACILLLSSSLLLPSISTCGNKESLESLFSSLDKLLIDCSDESYDCNTAIRELGFVRELAYLFYTSCPICKKKMKKKYYHLISLFRDSSKG